MPDTHKKKEDVFLDSLLLLETKNILVLFLLRFKLYYMSVLKQIAEYLYLKKKDPNAPESSWLKYMHGMNRISLIMGLIAVVIVIIKLFTRK